MGTSWKTLLSPLNEKGRGRWEGGGGGGLGINKKGILLLPSYYTCHRAVVVAFVPKAAIKIDAIDPKCHSHLVILTKDRLWSSPQNAK